MQPHVLPGAAIEGHEAAVAAAQEPPIRDAGSRRDARLQLTLAAGRLPDRQPSPHRQWSRNRRRPRTPSARTRPPRRPRPASAGGLMPDRPPTPSRRRRRRARECRKGRESSEGGRRLIAPAFSAIAGVEGVEPAVAAGDVEHAVAKHRAGADGVPERGPDQLDRGLRAGAATPPRRSLVASSVTQLVSGAIRKRRSFGDRSLRDPRYRGRARMRS